MQDKKLFYGVSMKHIEAFRASITSKETIYQWRRQYVRENKSNVSPTLTANMNTVGLNIPLILTDDDIRKLSPKEQLNFQDYPKEYIFPNCIADSAKYKRANNSLVFYPFSTYHLRTIFPSSPYLVIQSFDFFQKCRTIG